MGIVRTCRENQTKTEKTMTLNIEGIKIEADTDEAMSLFHDIDALVNQDDEWEFEGFEVAK